jgi:hypothetical protein
MFQLVLTVLIVIAAVGFAIYRTVRSLRDPLRGCDGCDQNCRGCSLEDLKKEIDNNAKSASNLRK